MGVPSALKKSMKITIQAKPGSKHEGLEVIDETHFVVAVQEPPVAGRANRAILRVLAQHFSVSPGAVRLLSGYTSRTKTFEITR